MALVKIKSFILYIFFYLYYCLEVWKEWKGKKYSVEKIYFFESVFNRSYIPKRPEVFKEILYIFKCS